MKFTLFSTALAVLAPAAFAAPTTGCVTLSQANTIVHRYIGIQTHEGSDLGTAAQTAKQLLVANYEEISDSILSLEQQPLGGVTFQGRANYTAAVLAHPATTQIETLGVYVAGCNKVLWQWNYMNVDTSQYEVKGFSLMTVNRKLQIEKTELEFNSVAWGLDTYQLPTETSSGGSQETSGAPRAASGSPTPGSPASGPPAPSPKV